jgi:DNA-binding NarL/FixJ family response regulator
MMNESKIRVLIVDDHFVVRIGLKTTIDMQPDMEVVAEASTGQQAIDLYAQQRPDIALVDLRLPGMTGFETTAAICKTFAGAKVIVISSYEGEEDIFRALQAGARSYLPKSVLDTELTDAIRAIHSGGSYIPPTVAGALAERAHHPELSVRELEVLRLIVRGHANKEIATQLSITEGTVKLHVGNLLTKLGVQDRTQASTVAIRRGLVHLD